MKTIHWQWDNGNWTLGQRASPADEVKEKEKVASIPLHHGRGSVERLSARKAWLVRFVNSVQRVIYRQRAAGSIGQRAFG